MERRASWTGRTRATGESSELKRTSKRARGKFKREGRGTVPATDLARMTEHAGRVARGHSGLVLGLRAVGAWLRVRGSRAARGVAAQGPHQSVASVWKYAHCATLASPSPHSDAHASLSVFPLHAVS